jgi:hypothetical protein
MQTKTFKQTLILRTNVQDFGEISYPVQSTVLNFVVETCANLTTDHYCGVFSRP